MKRPAFYHHQILGGLFFISRQNVGNGVSESKIMNITPGENAPDPPTFTTSVFYVRPLLLEIFHSIALKRGGNFFR